jgi:diguanylate cyclase (GGDEF)-like protein
VEVLQSAGVAEADPDQNALVEETLAQDFPCLVFPAALENKFIDDSQDARFKMILEAGLASILLFGGLMVPDIIMMPDIIWLGFALRIGVYAPVIVAGLYLLHQLRRPLLTEWMVAAGGTAAGLLSILMYTSSTSEWAFPAVVELNIIVVFVCAFARFWPAVALSVVMAMAHAFVITTVPDRTGILAANTTLLLAVSIAFSLYGNYKIEHEERMAFLHDLREKALDIERLAARDRLARMATIDPLTGVANRRQFDAYLDECLQSAAEKGWTVSLAMIDIDHFKLYNDHYGHQAGDRCLIAVAQALKGCTRRPGDLVSRWGGEEFAVVMMDADAPAAAAAGERMRRAVQSLGLTHAGSKTAAVVTISVGVVSAKPGSASSVSGLLQRADAKLYEAKASGRNRACHDPLETERAT